MVNSKDPTLLKVIGDNPADLISCVALVSKIIITIFNYFWFNARRRNERRYNLDFTFYQLLVLDISKNLIQFSSETRKLLASLINECHKNIQVDTSTRSVVERHIEDLEGLRDDICVNHLPLIKGYSVQLGDNVEKIIEEFYDKATDIFSKFDRNTISPEVERKMGNFFAMRTQAYIEKILCNIKNKCPRL